MAKTRSQTGNISVKKEEDVKPTLILNGVSNTRSSGRITKRKPSVTNNRRVPTQQVKIEEDTDAKSLLQLPPNSSNSAKRPRISQEQINQLIHYIVNDNMSINKASRKVNISLRSGCIYYNIYKRDPEKRILVPRIRCTLPRKYYTQEQVGNLIRYISDDKMTVKEVSVKANMTYTTGTYYYAKYLKNPNHAIPVPRSNQSYTQDQMNEFIDYITNHKMSIAAASKKAKIKEHAGQTYYHNYFKVENPDIPIPSHITTHTSYTQEQIKEVIGYIVDGKMSIAAASRKVNVTPYIAGRHYRKYLIDSNMVVPILKNGKRYTQDEINEFIGYIVDGKMSVVAASKKANMDHNTGHKYYHRYLKDNNIDVPILKFITQDQKNELIGYIVHDKMSVRAASKKANMSSSAGSKYYHQYIKDHNINLPIRKHITQEDIGGFIGYIVHDKMTITAAAKKANMCQATGLKYYHRYLKNQKRNVPT